MLMWNRLVPRSISWRCVPEEIHPKCAFVMKTLLILRHAKSSWKHPGLADHIRPLNKRGQASASRMGQLLYEEDLVPDVILCSPALRAVDTANLVAEACGFDGEMIRSNDLYPGWPEDYLDLLRSLTDAIEIAMVVGHNPGLEALLELLTDESEHLPTAAIALVRLPINRWSELKEETEGDLQAIWRPRSLPD